MFEQFTLGIEEEFQIVDPVTRELRSHVSEILEEGRMILGEQVKPEMIQAQIEVGTGICRNIAEARADITRLRATISQLARKKGLAIVAASTHPISQWKEQQIYDDPHYALLIDELQMVARSLLIFGLHVHVGVEDRERQVHIMNAARYFDLLLKTNSISNPKKIWWDVRMHPNFPTLEFRVCDIPTRVDDTVAITALFQAIVCKLDRLIEKNLGFRLYRRMLIQENKWRAVRYGLQGKMIDFGKQIEVPTRDLIRELLEFVDDVLDDLGSRKEVEHIHTILKRGTSADEQLQVYRETTALTAVVARVISRTVEK